MCRDGMVLHKKKHVKKFERTQRPIKMVPAKRCSFRKNEKEMELPTLEERKEMENLLMIYKPTNNLEWTDW